MNKGIIDYMYDGLPTMFPSGPDSLGWFIVSLLLHLLQMQLKPPDLLDYYAKEGFAFEKITKIKEGYVSIKDARERRLGAKPF